MSCVQACPGKIPKVVKGKQYVLICDLCSGDPACVKECARAGYNALRVVRKPRGTSIKHYARPPEMVVREVCGRVLGD